MNTIRMTNVVHGRTTIVRANRKGKIRVSRKGTMNSQEKRDIKPY